MVKKLFVRNLSWQTTEETLRTYFSGAGEVVEVIVLRDKFSGRSKGYGFVEFATEEQAEKALNMFNNVEFEGRTLYLYEARPREERDENDRGPRGGNGGGFRRPMRDDFANDDMLAA